MVISMVDPRFTKLDFPVTKGMSLLNHHLRVFGRVRSLEIDQVNIYRFFGS